MATPREPSLSYCAQEVRRFDGDRFLVCLFAPTDRREALFALHAFNVEIARTREVVTEPLIGRMRLQWWRDAVTALFAAGDGDQAPSHPVLTALAAAVRDHGLSRRHFDTLIDAREADLVPDGPATLACLVNYAEVTAAPLVSLGLEVVGARDAASAAVGRDAGIAFALSGLLRAVPFHLRQRRVTLPADRLRAHGVSPGRLIDRLRPEPGLAAVMQEVAAAARAHLDRCRAGRAGVPAAARPVLRLATLADLYLHRVAAAAYDPFRPGFGTTHPGRGPALLWAALRGRY